VTLRVFERCFAGLALFLASAALFPLMRGGGNATLISEVPTDPRLGALQLGVYLTAALLVLRRRVLLIKLFSRNKLLFGLVAFACASITWSNSSGTTMHNAIALVMTTVLGVYLATAFWPRELASLVSWFLLGLVVLSAGFALFAPQYGLDHLRGEAWRGVFTTKNELGRIAVLACAVWLLRALTKSGSVVLALAATGACGYVLARSGSKTGVVVLVLLAIFLTLLPALRAHSSIAIPTTALLAGTALVGANWLMGHADAAAMTVGGDSTFTGRSEIWAAVWSSISAHPMFGYGFGAFWRGVDGPSWEIWAATGSTPPHAHNGLLDLWLDLGAVGVVLMVGAFAVAVGRAARVLRRDWSFENGFPALFLVFLFMFNVTESALLKQHSLFWLLLVVTAVQLTMRRAPRAAATRVPVRAVVSVPEPAAVA
jgi:O-antigen ligase